jgi:hypothetical protein
MSASTLQVQIDAASAYEALMVLGLRPLAFRYAVGNRVAAEHPEDFVMDDATESGFGLGQIGQVAIPVTDRIGEDVVRLTYFPA